MADDEPGFTFVDKRRVSDSGDPPDAAPAVPETGDPEFGAGDPDVVAGSAPDIYGVLGYCISLLATEAWQKLGLLADPQSGEANADLGQAKVAIDAVSDLAARLEAAPSEAVPASLRRDLKTLVNDLRLNYVARRGEPSASRN